MHARDRPPCSKRGEAPHTSGADLNEVSVGYFNCRHCYCTVSVGVKCIIDCTIYDSGGGSSVDARRCVPETDLREGGVTARDGGRMEADLF